MKWNKILRLECIILTALTVSHVWMSNEMYLTAQETGTGDVMGTSD